jgi:hypothetical protein
VSRGKGIFARKKKGSDGSGTTGESTVQTLIRQFCPLTAALTLTIE